MKTTKFLLLLVFVIDISFEKYLCFPKKSEAF